MKKNHGAMPNTEYGDEKTIEKIEKHYEEYLGKIENVLHEIASEIIHLDVYHFAPTPGRDYHVLATIGMSHLPMTVPQGYADCRYAELLVCLPANWDLSEKAMQDNKKNWPVSWLKLIARFPHENNTWIWYAHTLPNGDPAEPLADNTGLIGFIILPPLLLSEKFFTLPINNRKKINFFCIVPLYNEEMEYKLKHGFDALADLFDRHQFNEVVDIKRKNLCL